MFVVLNPPKTKDQDYQDLLSYLVECWSFLKVCLKERMLNMSAKG